MLAYRVTKLMRVALAVNSSRSGTGLQRLSANGCCSLWEGPWSSRKVDFNSTKNDIVPPTLAVSYWVSAHLFSALQIWISSFLLPCEWNGRLVGDMTALLDSVAQRYSFIHSLLPIQAGALFRSFHPHAGHSGAFLLFIVLNVNN